MPLIDQIRSELAHNLAQSESDAPWTKTLAQFYHNRQHQPVWLTGHGLKSEAELLVSTLTQAPSQGLRPEQYHFREIQYYRQASKAADLAHLDLLLTDAYRRYCEDIHSGRTSPEEANQRWYIEAKQIDHLKALETAMTDGSLAELLSDLHPRDPRYMRLRTALAHYRQIEAKGGWPQIKTTRVLELGMQHPEIAKLRIRLALSNDTAAPLVSSTIFDSPLQQAVVRFQQRHGLGTDGKVGPRTRTALNVPVSKRIAQIMLNMERWRWAPRSFEPRHILVNMAAFQLDAIDDNRSVLSMRVIIGRRFHSTPSFAESMSHLVINPYWNVPTRLAVRDFLPKLRRNPNILKNRGIRVFSEWSDRATELDPAEIDWNNIDPANFRYWLRQDPGPRNALGRIKFMLPNRFAIYLHDTPQKALFDRDIRAYSSGCIRIEQPLELANFILGDSDEWNIETLQGLIDRQQRKVIRLTDKLPVYMVYWTAWVEPDGTIQFRDDVYGRDQGLKLALNLQEPGRNTRNPEREQAKP